MNRRNTDLVVSMRVVYILFGKGLTYDGGRISTVRVAGYGTSNLYLVWAK